MTTNSLIGGPLLTSKHQLFRDITYRLAKEFDFEFVLWSVSSCTFQRSLGGPCAVPFVIRSFQSYWLYANHSRKCFSCLPERGQAATGYKTSQCMLCSSCWVLPVVLVVKCAMCCGPGISSSCCKPQRKTNWQARVSVNPFYIFQHCDVTSLEFHSVPRKLGWDENSCSSLRHSKHRLTCSGVTCASIVLSIMLLLLCKAQYMYVYPHCYKEWNKIDILKCKTRAPWSAHSLTLSMWCQIRKCYTLSALAI